MEGKHAPGPWRHWKRTYALYEEIVDANGNTLARQVNPDVAPILAAAPDLLEALEKLLNTLPDGEIELAREVWGNTNTAAVQERIARGRSAVTKANGKCKGGSNA